MEPSHARGFTLIEIIVSISIILLLSGVFIVSYNNFNSAQRVKSAASEIVINLESVRSKAASGFKPSTCLPPTLKTLVGYQVVFSASGFTAQARCTDGATETGEGDQILYSLPPGVQYSSLPATILFYPLNRGASVTETITLTGSDTPITVPVTISASGTVSD